LKNGRVRQWVEHFLYTPLRKSLPRHVFLTLLLVGLTAVIGVPAENLEAVLAITVSEVGLHSWFRHERRWFSRYQL